jgi:RNA polymerase sigma-54 factor
VRPEPAALPEQPTFQAFDGGLRSGGAFDPSDESSFEARVAAEMSLHDHLERQLAMSLADPVQRLIGEALIAAIEDTGYLGEPVVDIADRLGVPEAQVLAVLAVIQGFEPSGVGARSLAECLALQLREQDRLDPAMETLIAHLDLLARRDFATLRRLCRVDEDDIAEMVAEIRRLQPKPGLAFGRPQVQLAIPDVIVRAAPDRSWLIELNSASLPRVLVNRAYFTRVSRHTDAAGKAFIETAWNDANWLVRSLEQRARTILKVASEIVRQQDGFLAYGVTHLRPLNLKVIAEQVQMHESTVSRVTSNKFMATPRGIFEMKYFFTAAIASTQGGEAHSAEAVRFRIKQLIESESPGDILSDDSIVERLKASGIDIARRTVAKYREGLRIPSSAVRRREKRTMG